MAECTFIAYIKVKLVEPVQ